MRALVIIFSAIGRTALALASVVVIASAAINEATRLAIIDFWCAELPPKRRPFLGVAGMFSAPNPQRQAPLVQLLDHLVEGLLAEIGDSQEVVLGLLEQLADGVDLGTLETVAGTLREI